MSTPVMDRVDEHEAVAGIRPGAPRWVVLLLVVALAAVSGVAVWLAVDRGDRNVPTPPGWSEATPAVMAIVDGSLEAYNSGDWGAFAAYFTEDAVFQEVGTGGSGGIEGRDQILDAMALLQTWGARYTRVGDVLQNGNVAMFPVAMGAEPEFTELDVVVFDADMKIVKYWTIVTG